MADFDRNKWDAKYRAAEHTAGGPCELLEALANVLPIAGNALDLAGGAGRNAIWLARRGLAVTLADISPVALEIAQRRADEAGVAITTLEIDLEQAPLPPGPWDVVLMSNYLDRTLLADIEAQLAEGGWLLVAHPTKKNLTRHRTPSARYLLEEGELPGLIAGLSDGGLETVVQREGWTASGRHEAWLAARRRAS